MHCYATSVCVMITLGAMTMVTALYGRKGSLKLLLRGTRLVGFMLLDSSVHCDTVALSSPCLTLLTD